MEPGTIVRVAFFPMGGYNETAADGSFTGMDVEYLDALCSFTNWEIEYVPCASWDDALQMLQEKKVDLVGSAQYSQERAEIFDYAGLPSGYTFGVIAVNPDSGIAYEDFKVMGGLRYGMVKTYVRQNEFRQYMADNGISDFSLVMYEDTAAVKEAMNRGEVDAAVYSFTEIAIGQRMIGRFAARPYYYITYKNNTAFLETMNRGIADLKINRPDLENKLMEKFYQSRLDKTIVFSTGEKEYIADGHSVRVGYLDGCYPFSYVEDGEFAGMTRNLLDRFAEETGIEFTYVLEESMSDAKESLVNGSLDILSYYVDSEKTLESYGLTAAQKYADMPLVMVGRKHQGDVHRLALIPELKSYPESVYDENTLEIRYYSTELECLEAIQRGEVDAALCNGYLAEYLLSTNLSFNNLEIQSILSSGYDLSMIMKTGANQELYGIISKAMPVIQDREINEYIMQENVMSLLTVDRFIRNHSMEIIGSLTLMTIVVILAAWKMIQNSRKISRLMYMDDQLDITNQNYLLYHGSRKLVQGRDDQYALVSIDISQFRVYNTLFGWDAGEKLLKAIVSVLKRKVDSTEELFSRSQGERFLMMLLDDGSEDALKERLVKIRRALQNEIFALTNDHMVIKMGVCRIPPEECDIRVALTDAIQALDDLRDVNLSSIRIYDEALEQQLREEHEHDSILESVRIEDNFETFYQVKVDIRTGKVVGAEAVARFHDPTDHGALRSPDFFVPHFEKTGKVVELDFFVMECVCRMIRKRLDEGKETVPVSCNFSRRHFLDPEFPDRFMTVVNKYRIPLELIEAEITETMAVEELQYRQIQRTIHTMHSRGVRLSIDDFGSGYSSLGVLEQIPASVIKLDRSFLLNKEDRRRQINIMKSIVKLAEELEATIVCEGIETEDDVALMYEIGAYVAQGFRYGKPVPEAEFAARMEGYISPSR